MREKMEIYPRPAAERAMKLELEIGHWSSFKLDRYQALKETRPDWKAA